MSGTARLGLGTAQLGLDYGITNTGGRVNGAEAAAILARAERAGITLLDTAHLYGVSEAVVGALTASDAGWRIVTKTPKFCGLTDPEAAVSMLNSAFSQSIASLRRAPTALLFHDPSDLLGPHGEALWAAASMHKARGHVAQIGASIYDGAEVDALLDRYSLDLVQLPWNPLDPRLADGGQLDRLHSAGVEIHARSLFLQGLLLADADSITPRFGTLRDTVAELDQAALERRISRLELLLALAFREPRIDQFLCGVTTAAEVGEIALAAERAEILQENISFQPSVGLDPRVLNPARWDELR